MDGGNLCLLEILMEMAAQDIVLGNIGENFYLQPDLQNPVKLMDQ